MTDSVLLLVERPSGIFRAAKFPSVYDARLWDDENEARIIGTVRGIVLPCDRDILLKEDD